MTYERETLVDILNELKTQTYIQKLIVRAIFELFEVALKSDPNTEIEHWLDNAKRSFDNLP